jgi:hypothetical protein
MWFKRSYVIENEEIKLREFYEKLSSARLRSVQGSRHAGTPEHGVIAEMLEEREFWKRFWTGGVISWISLAVAVLALYLNLKHRP